MRLPRPGWKSLSSEIILVYATLSVTLVIVLSFVFYRMHADALEKQLRQELLSSVDRALLSVNTEIEERVREAQDLSLSPTLRDAAAASTRWTESRSLQDATEDSVARVIPERPVSGVALELLTQLKEAHPYIAEIIVTDRHGINSVASDRTTDFRQDDEPWWQLAVAQRCYLGQLEYDASARCHSYSIAMAIADDPSPPLGVIKMVFNLEAIDHLIGSTPGPAHGFNVLISDDGLILSHPDKRQLHRSMEESVELAPLAPLFRSSLRGVDQLAAARSSGHDPWIVAHSRLMRPSSMGPLNWTAATIVSRSELLGPVRAARRTAAMAGLLFVIAAVPMVVAVSRRLIRPLTDLAGRAQRIKQGDLGVSLTLPSTNEIGRLADALASMVENLKASYRRTLDINAGLERTVRERTEELQRKNRQIESQNKRVLEASRLKSQFLANMSHELRTPLNAVLALSDILAQEMSGPLNEEQLKQITVIHRSGKALLQLINDVLDLSRIEAGRMTVEKSPISVQSLISLVSDTLRPLAEDKSLDLVVKTAADLPLYMTSDEHKLRQILINLIGNGIKFTERGHVTMDVRYQASPPAITFAVSDTGIGIPLEAQERIFEEFHQADGSTTRKYGGTGLGLTISRRMAELMGGTLTVRSVAGEGSTFALTVPYQPSEPVPATAVETFRRVRMQVPEPALINTTDDTITGLNGQKPIVLVAEDELDSLYIMKKYLNRCGCQVVFARDGNEVMQKAKRLKPIAITLDLVLPRRNGWEVLSDLKSDPETRDIPVIIASVLDNQERGFCLGAYRYLVKPVSERDLSDTIHQIQWDERKNVKRVLIIDDNIVDADLTTRLLPASRYHVIHCSDGRDALSAARRETPDLILLDLGMPEYDGFQVLDSLKSCPETSHIPVVIHTARDLTPREQERLKRGAERIFRKNPLEPARMLEEIGTVLKMTPTRDNLSTGEAAAAPTHNLKEDLAMGGLIMPASPCSGTILLVEDDHANQYTLQLMLVAEGYEVHVAENGRDAIAKVASLQPDIVLMDMMMPVMGGHEATRTIKSRSELADIPVIALTAAAMTGDREKALAAGCDDYISKPVDRSFLLDRVDHWLKQGVERKKASR